MICVDSYGWIERFTEGPKAPGYNAVIDDTPPEEIVTSALVPLLLSLSIIFQRRRERGVLENIDDLYRSGTSAV